MAVIQFYGFIGLSTPGSPGVDFSNALNALEPINASPPTDVNTFEVSDALVKTSNLPISEVEQNFTAWRARSFFDDYYNRIHITPKNIDLGNLLANQERTIDIWNAYLEPQLLNSITPTGNDGIDLIEPVATPTMFAALELRNYDVLISTSGAPVISASYLFDFPLEDVELTIVGRRVVIWAYKPNYPVKESLEWKTDIIPSFNGEQRIRLRDAARQSIVLDTVLSPVEFIKAKALAFQWVHRVFGVPIWMDMRFIASVSMGATSINVNTLNADFRSDDIILVWQSNDIYEAAEISNVTSGSVTLKLPLAASYVNAYVMPIRYARTLKGINFTRDGNATIKSSIDFTITNNVNKQNIAGFLTYKNKPVLVDALISSDTISDMYTRTMDVFDNGSGPITIDVKNNYVGIISKVSLKAFGAVDIWRYKGFFHSLFGRQKTFFIPSWSDDFKILEDIGSATAALKIQYIGYTLYYSGQFMLLETVAGVRYFNKILSSSIDVDGSEIIYLETSFGVNIPMSNIKRAGILKHVRMDTDKLDFDHDVAEHCSCSFSIREVPYVV